MGCRNFLVFFHVFEPRLGDRAIGFKLARQTRGGLMFRKPELFAFVFAPIVFAAPLGAATVLKTEPPMGALREGERVLVDDGSCGAGKIKEVIGGNHVKVGGTKQIVRERHCIPK
jgi:hypothetical protein